MFGNHQTAAEAELAISSWRLDMGFPAEHVAPRCLWAAPVIFDPLSRCSACSEPAHTCLQRWQFTQKPGPGSGHQAGPGIAGVPQVKAICTSWRN